MMIETNSTQDAFEKELTRSLEQVPVVAVPADFAARVRASLPAQAAPRKVVSAGRIAGIAAALLLTVAMFLLAPHTQAGLASVNFYIEILMLAELLGITYWLVGRPDVRS